MSHAGDKGAPLVGRGWREGALVLLAYAGITAALTYPLVFHLGTLGRTENNDAQFSIWNVAWVARTLVVDPRHVFDANIFYPHRWTLLYSEANLGAGLLAVPAYWISRSPYVANNIVTLLSFVLSATGSYYLVRHLTGERYAAGIAGVAFAFCPYTFAHLAHIQLLMTAGLPFSMLAFHRLADRPTAGRAAALGGAMAASAFACGYYGIYVMLMVGFATLFVAAAERRWADARYWRAIGAAALVAAALVAPLAWLYAGLQRTTGFGRSIWDARTYSADWRSYLASSAYAHAWLLGWLEHWREVAFPGIVATGLGVAGAFEAWRRRAWLSGWRGAAGLYACLALLAWWASLGPDGGLYRVLYRTVPGFTLLRAPSRFCVVVAFALSTLAGMALAHARRRANRPGLVFLGVGALTLAELAVPMMFRPVPAVEPAYRLLATLPRGPVLELPVYSRPFANLRSSYMLASTIHWMPLVDGYSDYTPDDFSANLETFSEFPTKESFDVLAHLPLRYAVFHVDTYPADAMLRLRARLVEFGPFLRILWQDDRVWLYEIVGFPHQER
jgi:hypothetical protein